MTATTDITAPPRNLALGAARVLAGIVGALQVAGVGYFLFVAPEEAVWLGPLIDVPVVALLVTGILLKLVTALAPGLAQARRIGVGLAAVAVSAVTTLIKVPLYDEPEGLIHLVIDVLLLTLLLLAGRTARDASH
jgi:hypothetical protein